MSDARRQLPAVDALLGDPGVVGLLAAHPRSVVVRAVRETLDVARGQGGSPPPEGWAAAVGSRAARLSLGSLEPVINGTGDPTRTTISFVSVNTRPLLTVTASTKKFGISRFVTATSATVLLPSSFSTFGTTPTPLLARSNSSTVLAARFVFTISFNVSPAAYSFLSAVSSSSLNRYSLPSNPGPRTTNTYPPSMPRPCASVTV